MLLASGLGLVAVLFGFVAVVDPWDVLPLSPRLPRVPISGNARFAFPALARSVAFDSAVIGTSTSRLLQPGQLNGVFGARFVNLAMNSATAWEQTQILGVFLRAHPAPRVVVVGLDGAWCGTDAARLTPRPFPAWMYAERRWAGYRELLTPYAVQEAANQFAVMMGVKRPPYGLDGYTRFVPEDASWDAGRRDAAFARWTVPDGSAERVGEAHAFPNMRLLGPALEGVPAGTRVILYFPPLAVQQQGAAGTQGAARWRACKYLAASVAARRGAEVVDMLVASPLTVPRDNYWDPLHFREAVAARVSALLAAPDGESALRFPGT